MNFERDGEEFRGEENLVKVYFSAKICNKNPFFTGRHQLLITSPGFLDICLFCYHRKLSCSKTIRMSERAETTFTPRKNCR